MKKVCVIGLWHLGLVSSACLADLGYEVCGFEPDASRISDLKQVRLPLYEPGLEDLIRHHMALGRICFTSDPVMAVSKADTVMMAYDTPVNDQDQIDLAKLEDSLKLVIPYLLGNSLFLIHSQVPVGTAEKWQALIDKERPGAHIDVVVSPENIRLGQAIPLFKKPDMIVIGAATEQAKQKAKSFFDVVESEKFWVNPRTAEMAKHALNVFFATSISFANEIGNLCDAVGADGLEIAKILKKDGRIGAKAQVRPGLGFAGATLARDLRAVQNLGKEYHLPTRLSDAVLLINEHQTEQVVSLLESYFHPLSGRRLTVFGLTYKPGTSTLRRSSSIEIMKFLKEKGVKLSAHDPKADLTELKDEKFFDFFSDPYQAASDAEGILVLTEWPEYRDLDFTKLKTVMKNPFFLDAKNHLDGEKLRALGFIHVELGRGQKVREKKCCA